MKRKSRGGSGLVLPPPARMPTVAVFANGACSVGCGGWGALLLFVVPTTGKTVERELSGAHPSTTAARMQIMAAVVAIEALKRNCAVTVYCQSQAMIKAACGAWKRSANRDLWQRLDRAMAGHEIVWQRDLAGHDVEIKRAGQLARRELRIAQAGQVRAAAPASGTVIRVDFRRAAPPGDRAAPVKTKRAKRPPYPINKERTERLRAATKRLRTPAPLYPAGEGGR